jgi:ribulose-phosphate 3-epimerase
MDAGEHQIPEGRRVAPSILAADWSCMWEQVKAVMDAGARVIHVDVMDGHFVPPITMGPQMVESLAGHVHSAGGWLDVHLMIERPEHQVEAFAKAGADSISIHWEATPHVHYALKAVRDAGCVPGLAINPATAADAVIAVVDSFDILLCMTVNPGWGGQEFIPHSTDKVRRLRSVLPDRIAIEVDGGIDEQTARPCREAGARLFVAGSAVFGAPDVADAYSRVLSAAGAE